MEISHRLKEKFFDRCVKGCNYNLHNFFILTFFQSFDNMSSLALHCLSYNLLQFFNLYCVFSTPQQITPTALSFQLQWFFYWIDDQPAPAASSQPDHRPTSWGDVSAVASVRPNQLSTYQISLKKPLRLLFRFSALHYTLHIHTHWSMWRIFPIHPNKLT